MFRNTATRHSTRREERMTVQGHVKKQQPDGPHAPGNMARQVVDGGEWAAKTQHRPPQQPAQPQYANYWAQLPRKRHQQEHRLQRPTECNNLTQHAKGRTGDCPGSRKETAAPRNVIQGGGSIQQHCRGASASRV